MGKAITPHSQNHLLYQLATPLDQGGGSVLIPVSVQGTEIMSQGFSYKLTAFSEQRHDIAPKELIGKAVTFDLGLEDGSVRYFNGYVKDFRAVGLTYGEQRMHYELTVVSWLWLLEQTSDCRVFQNKSIPDVIKHICEEWSGYGKTEVTVDAGNHPKERLLVQYNESNLNFINRLARRAGLFYYFTHDNGSHTVHFMDDPMAVPALAPEELKLRPGTASHNHLTGWTRQTQLVSGEVTRATYNYVNPNPVTVKQLASASVQELPQAPNLRRYHYTEDYQTASDGDTATRRDIARRSQRHQGIEGAGTYRHLHIGHQFKVTAEPTGQSFTLTSVNLSVSNAMGGAGYHAGFEAVPHGEARYPKGEQPVIASLQTAVVTGHKDDTVFTDHTGKQLGRVKVQFQWDREGQRDADSSCWLRVMQNGAGNGYAGFYALPRVGTEVVVAFENGNPDRPFVLGALPHPSNKPPYGDNPHRSGIKTQSFDANGGAAVGKWNELRFDDKKGEEEIYLQAEKNYNAVIKHDATEKVGNNLKVVVAKSESRDLGDDLKVTAGNSITFSVGGNSIRIDKSGITVTGGKVTINGKPTSIN